MRKLILLTLLMAALTASVQAVQAQSREEARLDSATLVLEELLQTPDQNVPHWLLDRAYAVAVVPAVIKVGLIAGGRRGKGALVVRRKDGGWSSPVFVNLTGGSFGFQFGIQATDVVLVFTSRAGIEGIVGGKVTLGADASVAAGPVGRQTSAATDIGLTAQVYSYSRAQGMFAGVALDGSALTIDHRSNERYYKRPGILASDLLTQDIEAPSAAASKLIAVIKRSGGKPAQSARGKPARITPPEPASAAASTAQESGVTTYPMEDFSPGEEPPE